MRAACGVEFAEASKSIDRVNIRGVEIPFANPELLWRMKQTFREKDEHDRLFLKELLANRKK
jgi:hypothetical protein